MILTRTPYRISFFGGGTDYPAWFREHGGAVLATAIDKCCYVSCRELPPFFDYRTLVAYRQVETVKSNREVRQPVVRGCLEYLGIEEGVEIHYEADVPSRTGLGTSSAFAVGLLQALHALGQELRSREDLAREAIAVEQRVLRETVGVQDQITAAYGGFNRIGINRDGSFQVSPVCAAPERLAALERRLLLFFSGFTRTASEIAARQVENVGRRQAELAAMQAMVAEGAEIAVSPARDLDDFGRLLHEAWRLKRGLSERVTTSAVDELYAAGRKAGALGGKLLGAGGGGFFLFYAPEERRQEVIEALRAYLRVPFRFYRQGSQVVLYEPSPLHVDAAAAGSG